MCAALIGDGVRMDGTEFLLKAFKAMVEVAGFAYLGQGLVGLLSGVKRDQNFVYVLFKIVTNPVTKLARFLAPRFVPDRHIPFVGFGLVLWCWFGAIYGLYYLMNSAKVAG